MVQRLQPAPLHSNQIRAFWNSTLCFRLRRMTHYLTEKLAHLLTTFRNPPNNNNILTNLQVSDNHIPTPVFRFCFLAYLVVRLRSTR